MRFIIYFLTVVLLTVFFESCKQGCKDNHAINYNTKAQNDDGSCLYCDSTRTTDGASIVGVDNTAPLTDKHVLLLALSENEFGYNGNGCKSEGLQTGKRCNVYLSVINLTSKSINFRLELFFEPTPGMNGWNFTNKGDTITINANDTINFGMVDTVCSNFNTGLLGVNIFNTSYF